MSNISTYKTLLSVFNKDELYKLSKNQISETFSDIILTAKKHFGYIPYELEANNINILLRKDWDSQGMNALFKMLYELKKNYIQMGMSR